MKDSTIISITTGIDLADITTFAMRFSTSGSIDGKLNNAANIDVQCKDSGVESVPDYEDDMRSV